MFENIGGKIKGTAKVFFWIGVISSIVVGIVFVGDTSGLSLLLILVGGLASWLSVLIIYGFGEIIEKLCEIERNTRGEKKDNVKPLNQTSPVKKAIPKNDFWICKNCGTNNSNAKLFCMKCFKMK